MAWNATITNEGTELLVQWAQGGTLTITGAKSGTEKVNVSQMMAQTDVSGDAHDAAVTRYDIVDSAVKYTLLVTPASSDYSISQFGIFAKVGSGSEILLALYQCDAGEEIAVPASSVMPDFAYTFAAVVAMDNTGSLSVEVDTSALVSQGDMEEALAVKLDKANVYNGLDKTDSGFALDARQGKALNDTLSGKLNTANVYNGLDKSESGFALDARQGKALNDAKLSKNGGTMTNSINFSSTINPSVRPSADQGIARLQYLDNDNNVIGGIRETHEKNDGALYNKIITRRTVNGNVKVCELGSGVSESGDYIYKVSSPEAFRNTLDVNCRINTTTVSNARVIRINVPKSSGHMFIAITSNVPSRSYVGLVTQTNNDAEAPRELRIAVGNATTVTFGNCMMTLDLGATATVVTVVDIIALEGSSFATVEKVS